MALNSFNSYINEVGFADTDTVACMFEDSWCGYTDLSSDKYFWTRKPGDKFVKGNVRH